jgi:hypothetical protein
MTSEHPGKPLEGTVISIHYSFDMDLSEPLFHTIIEKAKTKFNLEKYREGLRLGTIFFNLSGDEVIGVCWEESPRMFSHGDFDEPVESLPSDLILRDELV